MYTPFALFRPGNVYTRIHPVADTLPGLAALGPEPIDEAFSPELLAQRLARRQKAGQD
jgi:formamidopyrimidine-DNA glycosylase